jgi:Mannosylglycerate hydrolase MGH1-like glycoside hydrolase domain
MRTCRASRKRSLGTAQIQMVIPIAATAWDLHRRNPTAAFLEKAYRACSRWDEWLMRYRNTRRTGLCEAFCTYDTAHFNSPRFRKLAAVP